jgi:hypothetical protein
MWQTNQSMLPLDDPPWKTLTGGYQVPYDVLVPLHKLFERDASKELWDESWQELHHQGDLGTASYAAVPHLLEYARRSPCHPGRRRKPSAGVPRPSACFASLLFPPHHSLFPNWLRRLFGNHLRGVCLAAFKPPSLTRPPRQPCSNLMLIFRGSVHLSASHVSAARVSSLSSSKMGYRAGNRSCVYGPAADSL